MTVRPFSDSQAHSDATDFPPGLVTTCTSSTRAAPPAIRRASCGATTTFFHKPLSGGNPYGAEARKDLAEIAAAAKEFPDMTFLIAAPLMHGAASYSLFTFFTLGARLVVMRDSIPSRSSKASRRRSCR